MSDPSPPFISLALEGRASAAQIDEFVDRWHEEHTDRQLREYLGLTAAEYALWLVEPDMMNGIVEARAKGLPLSVMVCERLALRRDDGLSTTDPRMGQLGRWLADQEAQG